MASTPVVRYLIEDFQHIMNSGFNYTLDKQIVSMIQTISNQVGSPEYIKTPQFVKNDKYKKNDNYVNEVGFTKKRYGNNKAKEVSDEDWETIRSFQSTEIAKKEGIDTSIDLIRKQLNKITDKTYNVLKESIQNEIKKIINDDSMIPVLSDELLVELNKVGNAIFGIASGNKFYSEMYAKLYKELMCEFSFMKVIFRRNFKEFSSLFTNVEYCHPNDDYDKFCENNKTNETRRAISSFYVNLMKHGVIEKNDIIQIIGELQKDIEKLIDGENNKNVIEELSEVMFILVTNSFQELESNDLWEEIVDSISRVAKMKVKTKPSISSKTIFKYMDIIDIIQ